MSSLLDQIDRFSYTAQAIKSTSIKVAQNLASPYVRAVLETPLGDLARDVDPSELGLFTLSAQTGAVSDAHASSTDMVTDDANSALQRNEVTRVEFLGATPLRRPPAGQRVPEKEKEPEIYAEAALKYLDRYQSIRPMPRARQEVESILERLSSLRNEITQITEAVESTVQATASAEPTARDEEKRIQELNLRIKQMKARRDVLLNKQKLSPSAQIQASKDQEEADFWGSPAPEPRKRPGRARKSLLMQTLPGPGSGPRMSLGADESLLLSDRMDANELGGMLGDVSMGSIPEMPTPLPAPRPRLAPGALASAVGRKTASGEKQRSGAPPSRQVAVNEKRPMSAEVNAVLDTPTPAAPVPSLVSSPPTKRLKLQGTRGESDINMQDVGNAQITGNNPAPVDEDGDETMGEDTIVLAKPPRIETPPPPTNLHRPSSPPKGTETKSEPTKVPLPKTPPRKEVTSTILLTTPGPAPTPSNVGTKIPATPGTARKTKVQITSEVEHIVAKLWATVGDVIMPGHPFNTAAAATTNKPPRAKETIALLQNISTQRPSPTSPSASHSTLSLTTSPSTSPGAYQILTAHLLLTLLTSSPSRTLPLAQAKAALTSLGLASAPEGSTLSVLGGGQALEMRALYGCVTKRLLKIDRTGREQIVRFDV